MNRLSFVAVILVALQMLAAVYADPPDVETIPLDQIWAYNMPGTRDIRELESQKHLQSLTLAERKRVPREGIWTATLKSLLTESPTWPKDGQTTGPGFVVAGDNCKALQAAYRVLIEGNTPSDSVPPRSDSTLVVFSYQCGAYFEIQNVARRGNSIEVRYRLVLPLETKTQSANLALIPLGQLPPGSYQVSMTELPTGEEAIDGHYAPLSQNRLDKPSQEHWSRRVVSKSFAFSVTD